MTAGYCPALRAHHIAHAGIVAVRVPDSRVHTEPDDSFVLAYFGGDERILLDARW